MKKRLIALALTIVMAVTVAACGGSKSDSAAATGSADSAKTEETKSDAAQTEATYKIKLHHDLQEESSQHKGLEIFKDLVAEKTNGQVEIQIFPNNTLGSDEEVAEMLQTGSVDAALIPTAKLSGFYAPLQLLDLPFLFPSRDACYKTLDDPEFISMLMDPMEEIGFKGINFWESGFKQFTANKELHTPEDFKGVNFRTMSSPLILDQFKALGANPTPIDFGETYNALQNHTVDAEENPLVSIVNMKFYEVQSNCIISNHAYLAYALLFSKSVWDTFPDDIKTAINEAAAEAVQQERQMTVDSEDGYIETIQNAGCTVTYLTEEEQEALTEVLRPVHEEYRDVIGSDTLDKAYEIIEKNK